MSWIVAPGRSRPAGAPFTSIGIPRSSPLSDVDLTRHLATRALAAALDGLKAEQAPVNRALARPARSRCQGTYERPLVRR